MDWNHLRAFHETASTGSLSAAARRLGLTQPTLSRQIQALEARLGVPLFERIGRRLALTQTGSDLLDHIRVMNDAADAVALAASGRVEEIGGRVCISATDTYCAYLLPPVIARIRAQAPGVSIAIVAANELSNLHRREADIAVRHVRPDQPGLVGRHVCDTEACFYASRDWTARNPLPRTVADLAGDALIGFGDTERFSAYLRGIGIPMCAEDFRLIADSSVAIWEMVKRGMGVAAMLREIARRTPEVVELLPDMPPISVPVWLVTHKELQSSPRIRLVHDILAEELARL
ncbi:LysR family transcriptional regulator [Nitratireductor soli]|uniref:LysR family transcriptional regulator n=1 Tax=Nitratireductor soli TaxID=1670619 RepID=UPI001FCD7A96|nr:LysR family transcriptional regulator [Nitratireductor soli]